MSSCGAAPMRKAQVAEQASLLVLALIDDMYAVCALEAIRNGPRALHGTISCCRTGHMALLMLSRRCIDRTRREGDVREAGWLPCLPSSVRVGSAANLYAAVVLESRTTHTPSLKALNNPDARSEPSRCCQLLPPRAP